MRKSLVLSFMLLLLVASACSSGGSQEEHENNASNGDIRQTTSSITEMPSFLDETSDDLKNLYKAVAQNQDLLESIPCYCGCGEFGHTSNYDCFINQNNADGSLVWDNHAIKCQTCLDIAVESVIAFSEGTSVKEIRSTIDEKYQDGNYPEPTPTPEI
ncbi:PCYCGC domain-containing protein [Barrientosiimonas marina]|uniref:PCYCGC motif-containing (Lipo)protein n=1 Tax=Lentibacillus kimchii TaxID=1542911 RepID=A0ABW2UX12_9BACI